MVDKFKVGDVVKYTEEGTYHRVLTVHHSSISKGTQLLKVHLTRTNSSPSLFDWRFERVDDITAAELILKGVV